MRFEWDENKNRENRKKHVVHTVMDEKDEEVVRIISARKATPRERAFYEEVDR
jgi:uncharacterized DUF497 family protein